MFWIFGRDYTKCPHYVRRHEDTARTKSLELAHRKLIIRLNKMSKKDEELSMYLKKHMEDEGSHHHNTNKVLGELTDVMKTLVTDKEERDLARDKKDKFRDKILSGVALVVIIGIGKLLLDLYATNSALGLS